MIFAWSQYPTGCARPIPGAQPPEVAPKVAVHNAESQGYQGPAGQLRGSRRFTSASSSGILRRNHAESRGGRQGEPPLLTRSGGSSGSF